jgi:hypothetical protein
MYATGYSWLRAPRGKDRRRQHVDAALLDAQVAMLANLGITTW